MSSPADEDAGERAAAQERALEAFRTRGGVLRTKEILGLGIHPRTLYRLRDEGALVQLSRGVYRLAELADLAYPDLVTVALRAPRAVICLVSALAYHDATDEIPHEVHIALPRGMNVPRIDHPPVRAFHLSGPSLTEGIETAELDGVSVRIYALAKTVVDCFRFRNKLGPDVAIEALRQAVTRHRVKPASILHFARMCHMDTIMLPYVQSLR